LTERSPAGDAAACRQALDAAVARGGEITATDLDVLSRAPVTILGETLRSFTADRGHDTLPTLTVLASARAPRDVRRAAKRALYGLSLRGITPAPTAPRPLHTPRAERATRAWVSGIDGSGSRAVWIVFEDGYGALTLCSLILNDVIGVVEAAGGAISKKRLNAELATLRASQKLPWVDAEPASVLGLVAEALGLHTENHTQPPGEFERWRRFFASVPVPAWTAPVSSEDSATVEAAARLLELSEFASWFLDPESVQSDALELLQARDSRLIVSDQIKAEREEAIVGRVVEREFSHEIRTRWARRLTEMARILAATDRAEPARRAEAGAAALADPAREARHQPFARALARRALEIAGEVTLGRVSAAEVSRKPGRVTTAPAKTNTARA